MALSQEQKVALKAAIFATPAAKTLWDSGDFYTLTEWVNTKTSTKAWKPYVSPDDIFASLTISTYDNLTAGKRDALGLMMSRTVDATKVGIRNGFADIFAVTGAYIDSAQLAKMLNGACVEDASWAEVALGGTTPAAVGGVAALKRNFVGTLSLDEVSALQGV